MTKHNPHLGDANTFFEKNQNMVHYVLNQYFREQAFLGEHSYDDLFQVGSIGFVKAYQRFDPNKGIPFNKYVFPYIKGEIKRYLRDFRYRGFRVPNKVTRVLKKINQNHLDDLPVEEIGIKLNIDVELVKNALHYKRNCLSMLTVEYDLENRQNAFYEVKLCVDDVSYIYVQEFLNVLNSTEKKIVIQSLKGYPQYKIGEKIGMSPMDVSRKMKEIREKYNTYFDAVNHTREKKRKPRGKTGNVKLLRVLLKEGKCTAKELIEKTGCSKDTITRYRKKMAQSV